MANNYQWTSETIERNEGIWRKKIRDKYRLYSSWILFGLFFFVSLAAYNLRGKQVEMADWWAFGGMLTLYIIAAIVYRQYSYASEIFLRFLFPLILAILVLFLGTWGFYLHDPSEAISNHFFSAANLITLNSSEFKDLCVPPNVYMRTARLLGGFLAAYAFMLAFALAVGKENLGRLSFWWFRKSWFGRNRDFCVVIGNGTKALDLAYDLKDRNARFVFLDTSEADYIHNALQDARCWYFTGKAYSKKDLEGTYFWEATKVFVMNEEDEHNFRAVHEMDELLVEHPNSSVKINVHFESQKTRESVHTLLDRRSVQLNAFSVASNTATRLLNQYPIDRFTSTTKTAQIVIVGFTKQAQELVLACARMGHFINAYSLNITVYLRAEDKKAQTNFLDNFPALDKGNYATNYPNPAVHEVFTYTFKNLLIEFKNLPSAEPSLRSPSFDLYEKMSVTSANTLYVCLDDGMQNCEFLDTVLPRLSYLKQQQQRDIQVFSFYNYPDRDEQEYIETKLNSLASYIPIFCFGNMLDECSSIAIENEENLDLAKRIAFIYHCLYNSLTIEDTLAYTKLNETRNGLYAIPTEKIEAYEAKKKLLLEEFFEIFNKQKNYTSYAEKHWKQLRQIDRESNIQAANHAAVKLRQIGKDIDTDKNIKLNDEELNQLSEVEHRRWNAEKLLLGWLPYLNDTEWKTSKTELRKQKFHNYLVTFKQLPEYEKSKDWVQVMGVV